MIDYLRDPAEIYRRSFAIIRAEAGFGGLPEAAADVAVRLVHASGMVDIVSDLVFSDGAVASAARALRAGAPVLCDARMVEEGIIRSRLAGNPVICTLGRPEVEALARQRATTRAAAAVDLWEPHLEGAVVAIGNAPTALFRLLELLEAGGPRPAVILGFPVGFVGAVESKELLIERVPAPFITLRGRRGGSAMAAAAVNALAGGGP